MFKRVQATISSRAVSVSYWSSHIFCLKMINQVSQLVHRESGCDVSRHLRLAVELYHFVQEESLVVPIYLTRLTNQLHSKDLNIFCIMALHIWNKLVHDEYTSNAFAATFFGYTLQQFNEAEIFAHQLISFNSFISEEEFKEFGDKLSMCVNTKQQ